MSISKRQGQNRAAGTDAVSVFLETDMPHDLEPCLKRCVRPLKNCAGKDGLDMMASLTFNLSLVKKPKVPAFMTDWTHIALWPAYLEKIVEAGGICGECFVEHL